jgi:ABC-type antimicrobial peptide transport system ATPase subunit
VRSLEVAVPAFILALLLFFCLIAHDLVLVKQVSDRVAVMYLGELCEIGPVPEIYREPLNPFTLALLKSIPSPDPSAAKRDTGSVISGELPSRLDRRVAAGSAPAARGRRNAVRPRRRNCARSLTGIWWPVTSRCPRWPRAKPPPARRPLATAGGNQAFNHRKWSHYC